jgi:photosystem II stability/assembly factor-like uncharacterized protein
MKSIKYSVLLIGTVLMFLSNGYTKSGWYPQTGCTTTDLFGVWFIDDSTGFVVGGWPDDCILLTTDAGDTWSPQTYPEVGGDGILLEVRFSDDMNGWVVGQCNTILHTTDGGATWIAQSTEKITLNSIFCLDSNALWIAGLDTSGAVINHTTNGGDTWIRQQTGLATAANDVFFTNDSIGIMAAGWGVGWGWIMGETIDGGFILHTTNSGETWTIQEHYEDLTGLYGVFFANDSTGTVVGTGGTILHTTNAGATWTSQTSGTTVELWDVFFVNADTGFVVGGNWLANSHGIILHTTDGGATWIEQNIPTEKPLNKVFFINDSTGAAVGNDGTILRTTNGGETWTEYIWPVVNNEEIREPITRIYPNPTDDIINVEIENINNATIDIYNVSGRLVFNKALNSKVEKINVSGFPKGIYFVKVIQDKTVNILKVIVR